MNHSKVPVANKAIIVAALLYGQFGFVSHAQNISKQGEPPTAPTRVTIPADGRPHKTGETSPPQNRIIPPPTVNAQRQGRTAPRAQAQIENTAWVGPYRESADSSRVCSTHDEVWVGRWHEGDEHGDTEHLCAKVKQLGLVAEVDDGTWSEYKDETDSEYVCPAGKVITGRDREVNKWDDEYGDIADEHGPTSYRCSTVFDTFGYPMQVIPIGDWIPNGSESDGGRFICPNNQVMIGRKHDSDENGDTSYKCAALF